MMSTPLLPKIDYGGNIMLVTVKKQAHYSGSDIRSAVCEHMPSFKATGIAIT